MVKYVCRVNTRRYVLDRNSEKLEIYLERRELVVEKYVYHNCKNTIRKEIQIYS